MEIEKIKNIYISAFERFYQDIGPDWPKSKVENILLIFKRWGWDLTLNSPDINKAFKELETEGWLKLIGKDDIYITLQKIRFE